MGAGVKQNGPKEKRAAYGTAASAVLRSLPNLRIMLLLLTNGRFKMLVEE